MSYENIIKDNLDLDFNNASKDYGDNVSCYLFWCRVDSKGYQLKMWAKTNPKWSLYITHITARLYKYGHYEVLGLPEEEDIWEREDTKMLSEIQEPNNPLNVVRVFWNEPVRGENNPYEFKVHKKYFTTDFEWFRFAIDYAGYDKKKKEWIIDIRNDVFCAIDPSRATRDVVEKDPYRGLVRTLPLIYDSDIYKVRYNNTKKKKAFHVPPAELLSEIPLILLCVTGNNDLEIEKKENYETNTKIVRLSSNASGFKSVANAKYDQLSSIRLKDIGEEKEKLIFRQKRGNVPIAFSLHVGKAKKYEWIASIRNGHITVIEARGNNKHTNSKKEFQCRLPLNPKAYFRGDKKISSDDLAFRSVYSMIPRDKKGNYLIHPTRKLKSQFVIVPPTAEISNTEAERDAYNWIYDSVHKKEEYTKYPDDDEDGITSNLSANNINLGPAQNAYDSAVEMFLRKETNTIPIYFIDTEVAALYVNSHVRPLSKHFMHNVTQVAIIGMQNEKIILHNFKWPTYQPRFNKYRTSFKDQSTKEAWMTSPDFNEDGLKKDHKTFWKLFTEKIATPCVFVEHGASPDSTKLRLLYQTAKELDIFKTNANDNENDKVTDIKWGDIHFINTKKLLSAMHGGTPLFMKEKRDITGSLSSLAKKTFHRAFNSIYAGRGTEKTNHSKIMTSRYEMFQWYKNSSGCELPCMQFPSQTIHMDQNENIRNRRTHTAEFDALLLRNIVANAFNLLHFYLEPNINNLEHEHKQITVKTFTAENYQTEILVEPDCDPEDHWKAYTYFNKYYTLSDMGLCASMCSNFLTSEEVAVSDSTLKVASRVMDFLMTQNKTSKIKQTRVVQLDKKWKEYKGKIFLTVPDDNDNPPFNSGSPLLYKYIQVDGVNQEELKISAFKSLRPFSMPTLRYKKDGTLTAIEEEFRTKQRDREEKKQREEKHQDEHCFPYNAIYLFRTLTLGHSNNDRLVMYLRRDLLDPEQRWFLARDAGANGKSSYGANFDILLHYCFCTKTLFEKNTFKSHIQYMTNRRYIEAVNSGISVRLAKCCAVASKDIAKVNLEYVRKTFYFQDALHELGINIDEDDKLMKEWNNFLNKCKNK